LPERIAQVRQLYVDTLKDWPVGELPTMSLYSSRPPAKKAPAKKTPAKKTPAKKVPAKKVPAKKVPAKKVPAKKVPAKKAVPEMPRVKGRK
jgi:putative phosphoserine phosphatase/1-acylglycerol-3-phosphate O-acyltransferase